MNRRLIISGLAVCVFAGSTIVSSLPAAAHHQGASTCDEVGIWSKSNRARNGTLTQEQQVNARVSHTPSPANCETEWNTRWWKRTSSNYNVIDQSQTPDLSYPEQTISHSDKSVGGQTNYINARISGSVVPPATDSYTFYLTADDGVRMWFEGTLVIDKWFDHSAPVTYQYTPPGSLSSSDDYTIVIEHYQKTGGQRLWLEWKRPSSPSRWYPYSIDYGRVSTQHSSLHARAADGTNCVETVGYRKSDGELLIYGYGCGDPELADTDPEIISLGWYTEPYVTLMQKYNTMTMMNSWGHWVYRWDTGQWIFIGNTAYRPGYLLGWLESSGWNATAVRQTTFEYYKEDGAYVDFTVCGETEDRDGHQEMDPTQNFVSGDVEFLSSGNNTC